MAGTVSTIVFVMGCTVALAMAGPTVGKDVKYWSQDCVNENEPMCYKMCDSGYKLCSPCECRPEAPEGGRPRPQRDIKGVVEYWSAECALGPVCYKMCDPGFQLCSPCECRPEAPEGGRPRPQRDTKKTVEYWSIDCVRENEPLCLKECEPGSKLCSPCECRPEAPQGGRPRPQRDVANQKVWTKEECEKPGVLMCRKRCPKGMKMCPPCECRLDPNP